MVKNINTPTKSNRGWIYTKSVAENRILKVKSKNRKFEIWRTGRKVNSGKITAKTVGGNSKKKKRKEKI